MPDTERQPMWAQCRDEACGHRWVAVYLPMCIEKAANVLKRAACPMCGDLRPTTCSAREAPK